MTPDTKGDFVLTLLWEREPELEFFWQVGPRASAILSVILLLKDTHKHIYRPTHAKLFHPLFIRCFLIDIYNTCIFATRSPAQ